MTALKTRLLGLAGCLAILFLIVGTPLILLATDAIPRPSDLTWSRLTAPDDGTLALVIISGVAWIAWAVMVVSLGTEIVARLRGIRSLQLPGFKIPQLAAGRLVAVAALLFVSAPIASTSVSTPPAAAAMPVAPAAAPAVAPRSSPGPVAVQEASPEPVPTVSYTVKPGETLWKIAQELLGDGTRYNEIVALNAAVLNGKPDFINPGLVLRLPDERQASQDGHYVVQPGDTLSDIAQRELGDADAYPKIFEASRATVQPDGRHLEDPDLIRPNWKLTLPRQGGPRPSTGNRPTDHPERAEVDLPTTTSEPEPVPHESVGDAATSTVDVPEDFTLPGWALVGLTGSGAVLAGSLLLVLRKQRRTQLRYRTPGHVLVPPRADLFNVDKTTHLTGSVLAPRIDVLDRALRWLAASCPASPRVSTVELSAEAITLHLVEDVDLPAPWVEAERMWSIDLSADVPESSGDIAPYPLLVSLGMSDHGYLVLVNLEELRTLTISGDPERATALGRHLTAELSLNPWSTLVEVDTIGIASELANIDPSRHHHHDESDDGFLDELASGLEAEDPALEPDQFRVVITSATAAQPDTLQKVVAGYPGRPGAAIVTVSLDAVNGWPLLAVDSGGNLTSLELGLSITAAGLSADEAIACSTLVELTREIPEEATPPLSVDQKTTIGGALPPALTEPRPDGPAGERSLLPLVATAYEKVAATTREDVEVLAPVVPETTQAKLSDTDPDLDEDVARWQSPHLMGPKLTLLGPVSARTLGDPRKMAHRRPFYLELLAYLSLRPSGATADEISEAFGIQPERARKDIGILRGWLGTDNQTGKPHLPNARQTHVNGQGARYVLNGVATDLDLFRRLRTRGQSRGADGIEDLQTALTFVTGEPFTDLRPAGWNWLLEGERLDHVMSCAIVDTAHVVVSHALSVGDLDSARFAAETGQLASPFDETSRLDGIAVDMASGDEAVADQVLTEGVLNRSDDDQGPVDVPERSAHVIRQRVWSPARSSSAG